MIYTPDTWPRDRWQNFSRDEMACKHCGICDLQPAFMDLLQALRTAWGGPLRVTSGYRCPQHPVEAAKEAPGAHTLGCAADIGVSGQRALRLLSVALKGFDDQDWDFQAVGVQQKGPWAKRFLHLDTAPDSPGRPRPHLYSY